MVFEPLGLEKGIDFGHFGLKLGKVYALCSRVQFLEEATFLLIFFL